jgi:hypothetical protein
VGRAQQKCMLGCGGKMWRKGITWNSEGGKNILKCILIIYNWRVLTLLVWLSTGTDGQLLVNMIINLVV